MEDVYSKSRRGVPILHFPTEYAKLLGISDPLATFNMKYLLDKGLLTGHAEWTQVGDLVNATGISPKGIDAIDGVGRDGYAVNFSIFNVNAPVNNSQFSVGNSGSPSQNKVDSSESPGSTSVVGNSNVVNNVAGAQPIEMHPYDEGTYGYIRFGEWLMNLLFGTTKHDLGSLAGIAAVLTGIPVAAIAVSFYKGATLFLTGSPVLLYALATMLVVGVIFWIVVGIGVETTCPNCQTHFSFLRRNRRLVGRRNLPEKDVRKYLDDYSCDQCGFSRKNVQSIVEIPRQEGP